MRIERAARAAGMVACLLVNGPSWAQDAGHVGAGHALAERACAECHAIGKAENGSPNAAAPRFERIANVPGMTAIALSATLLSSHRTMPNVILKPDELNDLVAYILSLKRDN